MSTTRERDASITIARTSGSLVSASAVNRPLAPHAEIVSSSRLTACTVAARATVSGSVPLSGRFELNKMPRLPAAITVKAAPRRLSSSTGSPLLPVPESNAACLAVRESTSVASVASRGVPGRASRGRC